jgi:hypothetical protein
MTWLTIGPNIWLVYSQLRLLHLRCRCCFLVGTRWWCEKVILSAACASHRFMSLQISPEWDASLWYNYGKDISLGCRDQFGLYQSSMACPQVIIAKDYISKAIVIQSMLYFRWGVQSRWSGAILQYNMLDSILTIYSLVNIPRSWKDGN